MGKICAVPSCPTGKIRDKVPINADIVMFKVPRDSIMLNLWRARIPCTKKGQELASSDVVCGLHFEDKDIDYIFEPVKINGEFVAMERGHRNLKKQAVPSTNLINCNQDETIQDCKRKRSFDMLSSLCAKQVMVNSDTSHDVFIKEEQGAVVCITYEDIALNYQQIDLPSSLWAAHKGVDDEFVSFASFSLPDKSNNKTVIFEESTEPQVFFSNTAKKVLLLSQQPFQFLSDISAFLHEVDTKVPCQGTTLNNQYSKKCHGFVKIRKETLYQCTECLRQQRKLNNKAYKTKYKSRRLYLKNWRLQKKVLTLMSKVKALNENAIQ